MISAAFIWKQPRAQRIVTFEAAMVIIIITSQRLGEVILTVPWAIVVGLALLYLNLTLRIAVIMNQVLCRRQSSDEKPEPQNGKLIEQEAPVLYSPRNA